MIMEQDSDTSSYEDLVGFTLPPFDESSNAIIKLQGNGYDMDLEFTCEDESTLICESDDIPEDFGALRIESSSEGKVARIYCDHFAPFNTQFNAISLDHNGRQIYP